MDVHEVVIGFQRFVKDSWSAVEGIIKAKTNDPLEFQEAMNDWLQANWEVLVEFVVCVTPNQFLEVYGDGADCNDGSSRVFLPQAIPTHRIVCNGRMNQNVKDVLSDKMIIPEEYQFDGFIFFENGKYAIGSPFDHMLLSNFSDDFIVRVEDIRFSLEEIIA